MSGGYPVMLHLQNKRCVVVGGGNVAAHKITGLLNASASVTVISPDLHPTIDGNRVNHIADMYQHKYLVDLQPFLVIAATDQQDINRVVVTDSQSAGWLVSSVDGEHDDDFDNMAVLEQDPITVAISTGGASPALSKYLQRQIDNLISESYPTLARWMGTLRPKVLANIHDANARSAFWQRVLSSEVLLLLQKGRQDDAYDALMTLYHETIGNVEVVS